MGGDERGKRGSSVDSVCVCVCVCDRREKVDYTGDEGGDAEAELLELVSV